MKFRLSYIRQILLLGVIIGFYPQKVISQGTDISITKNPSLYIGLSVGPSQSYIKNDVTSSVPNLTSDKKGAFNGFAEIGYFFSKNIGISSGIGFISNSTQLALKTYQNKYTTTDSENESYERRVTGSDITELQKVGFLSVPVCVNLRIPFNEKTGFILQTGVNLAVPIKKEFSSNGTFTYKGYYSAYNVLLENLPTHDFPSDKKVNTNGELDLSNLGFYFVASAGVDFFIGENMQIAISGCYDKTLSNISNYSSPDKFQLSTAADKMNSLMGGASKATVQAISLRLSLKYYLR